MLVTVRLFASLREAAGIDTCSVALPAVARAADVKTVLGERYPRLHGLLAAARVARNLDYQPWTVPLCDGDELCFIPPVSGG